MTNSLPGASRTRKVEFIRRQDPTLDVQRVIDRARGEIQSLTIGQEIVIVERIIDSDVARNLVSILLDELSGSYLIRTKPGVGKDVTLITIELR